MAGLTVTKAVVRVCVWLASRPYLFHKRRRRCCRPAAIYLYPGGRKETKVGGQLQVYCTTAPTKGFILVVACCLLLVSKFSKHKKRRRGFLGCGSFFFFFGSFLRVTRTYRPIESINPSKIHHHTNWSINICLGYYNMFLRTRLILAVNSPYFAGSQNPHLRSPVSTFKESSFHRLMDFVLLPCPGIFPIH
ncbi:hypothetical protein QBC44DRAFT_6571 [Cladorrhinum sp. PSN332]|nr:hypothetical protein QBC44DRAFT_6571 [Cladorrhinum sp. PSN332]